MWTANSHGTGAIWKHSFHFSYIKRKSSNANSYQISKNNYSDEQGSVNPTRVKLKQYFICFFKWNKHEITAKFTSSIEFTRSRHIPWRRYRLQVAIRGISAAVVPCTLQQSKRLKNIAKKQRYYLV